MKKQRPLILILFLLPLLAPAQEYQYVPFPDSGAVWSEMYNPPMDKGPITYENFTLTGEDTLINELSYKKLYIFHDSVFDKSKAQCMGGIREDDQKRVYYNGENIHSYKPIKSKTSEVLLYDFSASIGDTIKNGNFYWDDYLVVKEIDTIQIGNTLRRVYQFFNVSWVKWIEGIGNIRGLLFTSGDLPTNGVHGDLICFYRKMKFSITSTMIITPIVFHLYQE